MKIRVPSAIKITLSVILIACSTLYVRAQSKEIQSTNLKAPDDVKIDGKIAEWGDDMQAYNKATKLYYTMANDAKNLYLIVKCKDNINTTKILGGGISLTINTADKKKDKDAFVIMFPVPPARNGGGRGAFRGARNTQNMTPAQIDSASRANHKTALGLIREISVLGFKDITDTIISIYNEYGIKAGAGFNEDDNFVFELAIPLKLLSLSAADPKEFAYNIKVNGIQTGGNRAGGNRNGGGFGGDGGGGFGGAGGGGGGFGGDGGGGGGFGGGGGGRGGGGGGGSRGGGGGGRGGAPGGPPGNAVNMMEELSSATDFWGKYTLYTIK